MDREQFGKYITEQIHSWSKEFYGTKVKKYADERYGVGTGDIMVSEMFNEPITSKPRCKGILANGKPCTKPGKTEYNCYCGFHKNQYKPCNDPPPRKINLKNRVGSVQNEQGLLLN